MPNNCCVNSTVIASAAKQSRGHSTRPLHCFVARAPRPCIASSQGLLAMTVNGGVRVPRVDFLISGLRLIAEGRRWLSAYIAARQPKWRKVGRAAAYQMLWVRGFRDHTISGRGFNLFKPLRRHFRATPFCRHGLSRRDPDDRNASVEKIDDRLGGLLRDGGTET